jgi:hypothetical protein
MVRPSDREYAPSGRRLPPQRGLTSALYCPRRAVLPSNDLVTWHTMTRVSGSPSFPVTGTIWPLTWSLFFPYKAEVPGSNPEAPTSKETAQGLDQRLRWAPSATGSGNGRMMEPRRGGPRTGGSADRDRLDEDVASLRTEH